MILYPSTAAARANTIAAIAPAFSSPLAGGGAIGPGVPTVAVVASGEGDCASSI